MLSASGAGAGAGYGHGAHRTCRKTHCLNFPIACGGLRETARYTAFARLVSY